MKCGFLSTTPILIALGLAGFPAAGSAMLPNGWMAGPVLVQAAYTTAVFQRLEQALVEEFDLATTGPKQFTRQANAESMFSDNEDVRAFRQRGLRNLVNGAFEERFGGILHALPSAGFLRKTFTARLAVTMLHARYPNYEVRVRLIDGTRLALPVESFVMKLDRNAIVGSIGIQVGEPRRLPARD